MKWRSAWIVARVVWLSGITGPLTSLWQHGDKCRAPVTARVHYRADKQLNGNIMFACFVANRQRPSRVPTLICHCEEHSHVAISMRLNTRRRTAVATATRLPRYARNDTVGTREAQTRPSADAKGAGRESRPPRWMPSIERPGQFQQTLSTSRLEAVGPPLLLRGTWRLGNPDEVRRVSANHDRCGEEIAALRRQRWAAFCGVV